ncbi:MAG: adenylate/guanylate cyclase domain-containing protein, partial [Planctomycetota bacterium]
SEEPSSDFSESDRLRTQLAQFASPDLIGEMEKDPNFLEAREREVTVLFADIQGFMQLSQRVGPAKTFEIIRNLMDGCTGCILDESGFIIDYAGDGIAAMWNAPTQQPDHAELACWAALNMQRTMSKLSQFWSFVANETLGMRIGIHSGVAHVGNAGSRWRLKYSPIGATVNLASRLEGCNKHLGTRVLISGETHRRLFSSLPTHRIGPVRMKGANQAIDVYQLICESEQAEGNSQRERYASALRAFEQSDFVNARQILQSDSAVASAAALLSAIEMHKDADGTTQPCIRMTEK